MKINALIVGAFCVLMSSLAFASHHDGIPNLDGPGALPTNPEPGQCFVHKFFPPKYEAEEQEIMIKEPYTFYTRIPPVTEEVEEVVVMSDAIDDVIVYPPEFAQETIQIEIKPSDPVWHVKCCKDKEKCDHNRCGNKHNASDVGDVLSSSHHKCGQCGHDKQGPCEQACFKPVRPMFKTVVIQKTVKDGWFDVTTSAQTQSTYTYTKLVTPGQAVPTFVPAEYMTVKVYKLVHPGYMKWVEGTCKKYTCNPHHLQSALKSKGYYTGAVDGVVGPQTVAAMNKFRADNGLGVHDEIDEATADALGIKK